MQLTGLNNTLSSSQTKMTIFLNYLQQVKPVLVHGFPTYEQSRVRALRMVVERPDFRLPFRQKAPTVLQALSTIYAHPEHLLTPEGLWNILMFQGVTYGSCYVENNLEWFDSCDEWEAYYDASTDSVKGDKLQYFLNKCAYGTANKH